ncbi:MAG: glycosyltransferase [Aquificales bacterium]|nr:glycosyltransferase [Aquificales bacterium]
MKVGLIIYGSLETISGGYLYDRKLVEWLRSQGDTIEIISLLWSAYGRHLSHNFSRGLFRRLREAPFDVLLQDELNHPSLFWLNGRLRPHISYPIISIIHHLRSSEAHPRWLLPLYRPLERRYLRSVDGFVFNSQTTKQVVDEMVGSELMLRERPFVVATPAGDRFQSATTGEEIIARCQETGPLRVLFVGNLIPRKGLHRLVAALSQLPQLDWQLDVVGETAVDSPYTRRIQQQISQTGSSERITIRGPVSDEQLAQHYQRSHILVVPSQYEGFGIVYLEGMSFALPAIGTTAGAAGEIIRDGENGYLVDVEETAVLAQHLQYLHQNRDELTRFSHNARQSFLTWPTWDDSMTKIRTFLQSISKGDNTRRAAPADE